ncbi:YrhA family protein [Hymenobacter weizhouensis]|uniref:YrhA family protein n=1 Tax=Hymenobacter sp. YIM 151500-1 TaxID=2987689 RepID=UPI0022264B1F|nr:YrhA family protein [Hymenobacter sp. YIM 151500-1]UYZ62000.1 YrhA family protein [Hymenobacter sp. YIM 151500-1]
MEAQTQLTDLLSAVLEQLTQYEIQPQLPLSELTAEAFKSRVASTLSYNLPHTYLNILSVTDGLEWNGVVLYASETRLHDNDELDIQGLLEANVQLRLAYTPDKDFIYFAESGIDAFRHNLIANKFEISDRVVGTSVYETFDTADELFQRMLEKMLEAGNDEEEDEADF